MIFFCALRHLVRNRKNTRIITLLIMVITALFFMGNSLLSESSRGLKQTYTRNFTGDIVIKMKTDVSMSIFGANTPAIGEFFTIPVLKHYEAMTSILGECGEIASFTSQVTGAAVADIKNRRYNCIIFGIDPDHYFSLFDGITIQRGHFLKPGEEGGMITASFAEQITKETKKKLSIGDPILLTTMGRSGFKIREVPLAGIYTYSDMKLPVNEFIITDPQTLRDLNEIMFGTDGDYKPPEDSVDILTDDPDSLFGETRDSGVPEPDTSISIEHLQSLLQRESTPHATGWVGGNWNFIIARLHNSHADAKVIKKLNPLLAPYDAEAVDWRTAAGSSALLVLLLGFVFNGGFILVMIAGIIGIINILLISLFRRTREIGTLRAIGASDSYILGLIFAENLILSFIAGILGILFGTIVVFWVNAAGINLAGTMIASLMGRQVLSIRFSFPLVFISLGTSLGLGFISSLYPVYTALKIEPIVAVAKG
ncbi:MAG: FtsX-like permease family protein [Spirochaetales bacterium]|nr:FtsX-like permease family protein [Spirochaetales bacterium]